MVPVLVDLLGDDQLSAWFVGNAAREAGRYPFSQAFCDALRRRRDDKKFDHDTGAMLNVFSYLVQFGNRSDLEWMERTIDRVDKLRRVYARAFLQEFRDRLNK